ncbi:MAG TPA: POTRA domain-containing protein [Candidatus Angelobacter sp.]
MSAFLQHRIVIRSILFVLLLCELSFSQTKPAPTTNAASQKFVLQSVTSSGSNRFSPADIVKAAGLKPGDTVTVDDVKQAANRLAQSGVFAQVGYRFDGRYAEYQVVDATQFLPVSFENFVWFADSDLIQRVHSSVPLFNGNVPVNGNLSDQICAALDALLKEKGIQGHATTLLHGKLAGPVQSMQFEIDGVTAKIAEIRFPGAAPGRVPLLQDFIKKIAGENYLQSLFADVVRQNGPRIYGQVGFLKAQFGTPRPVILKDDPAQPALAIEVPVQEGDQYIFAAANWIGARSISPVDLAKTLELKPGAPADTTQVAAAIANAKEIYGTKGYMFAQIKSTATLGIQEHTAVFNLIVDEGPMYHMGKLEVQAPDPQRAELVKKFWEMHEGDVYDSSYVKTFMRKHPRELATLAGWRPRFTQTIHDDTHVVDLALKFEKFQPEAQ